MRGKPENSPSHPLIKNTRLQPQGFNSFSCLTKTKLQHMLCKNCCAAMLIIAAALVSCNNNETTTAKPDFLAANIDSAGSPGADFFEYANGGWIKKNPIPGSESAWGIGYLVQEDIYTRL